MMAHPAAIFLFLTIIVLSCQGELISSDLSWFTFEETETTENGECETLIEISGNEITFQIKLTCDTASSLKEFVTMNTFIVGDYRRSYMSFYSDRPDMLVVIHGTKTKTCTRILKDNVSEDIPDFDCDQCKMTMERVWDDTYKQDISSDFVVRRAQGIKDNKCVETISFVGNGGGDSAQYDCDAGRDLEWIYIDGGLVLGDVKRSGFSFYSKYFGSFVTLGSDRRCTKKEPVEGHLVEAAISEEECAEVQRTVEQYWNIKQMRDAGSAVQVKLKSRGEEKSCKEIYEIKGNGIHEDANFDCKPEKPVEVLYIPKGFILADLKKWTEKCYFSETPNSMVVVKNKLGGKCSKYEYEGKTRTKKEVMSSSECKHVKQRIEEHVTQHESRTEVRVNRKAIDINNECKEYIEIKGHGIYDILTIDCDSDRKLMYFPSGFLLGDVRKHHVCLFSDTPNRVAMIDHRSKVCKLLTYTVNKKEVTDMDPKDCNIIKNVIEKHLSGKYKD